jgi:hypothetical protein
MRKSRAGSWQMREAMLHCIEQMLAGDSLRWLSVETLELMGRTDLEAMELLVDELAARV